MFDACELAVGLIRGRLRRLYPDASAREINLKLLEEIERVKQLNPPNLIKKNFAPLRGLIIRRAGVDPIGDGANFGG